MSLPEPWSQLTHGPFARLLSLRHRFLNKKLIQAPGVAGLGDDQLIGVIDAGRRLESRAAYLALAAEASHRPRRRGRRTRAEVRR
jgi:hypothetical protein